MTIATMLHSLLLRSNVLKAVCSPRWDVRLYTLSMVTDMGLTCRTYLRFVTYCANIVHRDEALQWVLGIVELVHQSRLGLVRQAGV
jgi:hypothetical protein